MRLFGMSRFLPLLALGLAACGGMPGEEPVYVLRDSLGRSVAMAGRSQLGDAAPGTLVRASIGGVEQNLMVGERVGLGPVLAPQPAATAEPLPVTSAALQAPSPPLANPSTAAAAPASASGRTTRRARATGIAVSETGANPSGRRRGPPARAISRSVM